MPPLPQRYMLCHHHFHGLLPGTDVEIIPNYILTRFKILVSM